MAHRYSRNDKEKWAAGPSGKPRRPPILIPVSATEALIEENRFTLIGRVTNPSSQKPRALVEFFLQHWKVTGAITGRDLGPHLFQFKFESENDLQKVLSEGPYHFKRWMMILQKWEPIVSDFFPALILFWVKVHGVPLHYWSDKTFETIGEELGPVEGYDIDQGRIRVWINGLKPLEMLLDISLAGEIKQVELEYEDLKKHCFVCHSLSHDRNDCPSLLARENSRSQPAPVMGISQGRTRERLDADRRRQFEKKQAREAPVSQNGSVRPISWQRDSASEPEWNHDKNFRYTYGARRDPHYQERDHREREQPRRTTAKERLSFTRESASGSYGGHNSRHNNPLSKGEWRPVGVNAGTISKSHSHASHTPTPTPQPQRELMVTNSASPVLRQRSDERSIPSQDRRSALDRLSLPKDRVPLLQDGVANADSGRLQEVDLQLVEESQDLNKSGNLGVPSSSRNPSQEITEQYDPTQTRSPIRTLSEDRLHVSLRLGPLYAPDSEDDVNIPLRTKRTRASSSHAPLAKKDKTPSPATKRRVCRSPAQGTSLKRRRVTKTQNSPRGKLLSDAIRSGNAPSASTKGGQPKAIIIPATKKKGTDFRSAPKSLP